MATGAIGTFAMHGEAFAHCQFFIRRLGFLQRRHIGGWRLGWRVENHAGNPRAARDGLGFIRARSHRHHRRGRNHAALSSIGYGLARELHCHRAADFPRRRIAIPFAQTAGTIGVFRINEFQNRPVLDEYRFKQEQRLHHHIHRGAIVRCRVKEILEFIFIRHGGHNAVELQPL